MAPPRTGRAAKKSVKKPPGQASGRSAPAARIPAAGTRKALGTSPRAATGARPGVAPPTAPGAGDFPVVALGASAGGLEAYEAFFRHLPPDLGMAFVVVSHLDPSHASILTEIVQRTTSLPAVEATDGLAVEPNHIYVIPPNRDLTIFHGALQLTSPEQPRGQRMPIDLFFRSLAEDLGERAVGVVLSGTGSDGSLGLRAILGAGGVTFAQSPATAKYDGMPSSAIQAGYATHVLPVEEMPELMRKVSRVVRSRRAAPSAPAALRGLGLVLATLRARTGHDFTLYKKSTVLRRIERRMVQHDLSDLEVYARYLKDHPAEVQVLFKELLINVTSFFRDPEAFAVLQQDVLPGLCKGKVEGSVFRAWVAGCATGEEAYSIAILLRELMEERSLDFKVQIYATDLDDDAIARARVGAYPPSIVQDVTPERLRRFFTKEEAGFRIKKELREMVVFATQNAIRDPPFTRLDLLSCRNLMIYLEPEAQDRLISSFHYALRPGGVLFLSPSESTSHHADLFKPINRKWTLFRTVASAAATRALLAAIPAPVDAAAPREGAEPERKLRETSVVELTNRALLRSFAPASVATDLAGNILYVHGDTAPFLRPAPGHATLNVIEMARGELQQELRSAFRAGLPRGKKAPRREVQLTVEGTSRTVWFSLHPLQLPERSEGLVLVTFQEAPAKPAAGRGPVRPLERGKVKELERALASSRDFLRTTVEEQQASTEELKSMNEELQSTNEELQSTNEELETSKEELQSVNEELVTVNAELQSKIEQLADMQNDMRNLLDSVSAGTIFLDDQLNIRRFTREATRVFRLVATDVGRPLLDIKSDLEGVDLLEEARQVLDSLAPWEQEVRTSRGASYLARLQPYRTLDNVLAGVVISFTDISARVAAENAVQEARQLSENIVDTVREPLLVLDGKLQVASASRSFFEYFKVAPADTIGRLVFDLGNRQWDVPVLRELLEKVLARNLVFDGYVLEHDFPTIGRRRLILNARRIVGQSGETRRILLAMEDNGGAPS
jgi:two-component system CheB/CheR fusion protein